MQAPENACRPGAGRPGGRPCGASSPDVNSIADNRLPHSLFSSTQRQ